MKIFGYTFDREKEKIDNTSVVKSLDNDGSLEYSSNLVNFFISGMNNDGVQTEDETTLINKYRELSMQPEIQKAIDDIVNETFVYGQEESPIALQLDGIPNRLATDSTKKIILDEFDYILRLLNFKIDCYEIFKRFYIDGRIYFEKVINKDKPEDGIIDLKFIDPRTIRKIKEIQKDTNIMYGISKPSYITYFLYNPAGINTSNNSGIQIAEESITYCNSGLLDKSGKTILSYLHQSIKPFNQYRMMKDSMVVYYHTRAPERRLFNVEIGAMSNIKAEQYMQQTIQKYKRKSIYDPYTGEIKDDKRFMAMTEDFWFPSREGRGTSVSMMAGGVNLSEIQQVVQMYKNELMESLNIPPSRYMQDVTNFTLGRSSEITRDEIKLGKFIIRLRRRFTGLLEDILGTQLKLKNIVSIDEWDEMKQFIEYDFLEDTHFIELKNSEIWQNRIQNFRNIEPYVGKFFSEKWIIKNILCMTEEEWNTMKSEIDEDMKNNSSLEQNIDNNEN